MLNRSVITSGSLFFRSIGVQSVSYRGAKSSNAMKKTPELYFNWIGSEYSLKGVAESLTHPNNLSLATSDHFSLGLYRMQKHGQWQRMEPVVDFIEKEAPFSPTEKMYGFLLMAYLKKGEYKRIIDRFDELRANGELELSQINWNIYLAALGKGNQHERLVEEFENLKKAGFTPDEYSFHALLEGHMIAKKYNDALDLLKEMKDSNVPPSTRSYTIMIHWLSQHNEDSRAVKLIEDMKAQGIEPNVMTYTALIHGLCVNGRQLEGFEWLKKLYSQKIQPNLRSYHTLIKSFDSSKQYGYVIRLWKMLQNDTNIEIPIMTRNFVTKIIKKAGTSLTDTK